VVTKDHGTASVREPGMREHGGMKNMPCEGMGDCPMQAKKMHANVPMMVATSDGGVVIMLGDKLVKYDKNLAVVKEVALSSEKIGGSGCPMMGEKKKMMMKTRDLGQPGTAKPAPAKN
jgi:hypothetical protein